MLIYILFSLPKYQSPGQTLGISIIYANPCLLPTLGPHREPFELLRGGQHRHGRQTHLDFFQVVASGRVCVKICGFTREHIAKYLWS